MARTMKGQVALITGASKGIGAAIALQLSARGTAVAVNYLTSRIDADRVVAAIKADGGNAFAVQGDATTQDDVKSIVAQTVRALGPISTLINNVGGGKITSLAEMTVDGFHEHFNRNVLSTLLMSQEAVKHFHPDGGTIINISSIAARRKSPGMLLYASCKAAVDAVTGVLSKELAPRNIRVNAVSPNITLTEGVIATGFDKSEFRKRVESITPMGRLGSVDEIASVVTFLASDAASYISGETFGVAGGLA